MCAFLAPLCAKSRKEILIGSILLFVTTVSFILFFVQNYLNIRDVLTNFTSDSALERGLYNFIFAIFMYAALVYQVCRLAFFWNLKKRAHAASENYKRFALNAQKAAPRVEVLIPCYREESHVIWQTLMSAALVDYPGRGVVLLIDNPPHSANTRERDLLLSARDQVDIVRDLLSPIAVHFLTAAAKFKRADRNRTDLEAAAIKAAKLYDEAADFLQEIATRVAAGEFGGSDDHTRKFFIERILHEPAKLHRRRATDLRTHTATFETLDADFARLSHMFDVRLNLFERKKYVNLSHALNKAANLNSYISIMGRRLKTVLTRKGLELVTQDGTGRGDDSSETIEPADADYIIILDADSFLTSDYAKCMVSALESPENRRAAVGQTPYTAIPGTPHVLERTAGATTDIHYYVAEGMSFLNAGYWVGASATVRKAALMEIAQPVEERGYTFPAYIQDKTVIEDTGATIDLIRRGWSVHNYPAQLSYSATPADFGALVVQRSRWANGGLIILSDLLRHLATVRPNIRNVMEALLRIHYLIMPACFSACMALMLIYPFDFKRISGWIYLTLPPYLFLTCRDLAFMGYRRVEIFRAYTLFLILLPVVLTGVKNSIRQIIFGGKAQFVRTPKIEQRTAIPLTCIGAILGLFAWSAGVSYDDIVVRGDRLHAVFAVTNALALGYGVAFMIGLKAMRDDISAAVSAFAGAAIQKTRLAFGARSTSETSTNVATLRLLPQRPLRRARVGPQSKNQNGSAVRLQRHVGTLTRNRNDAHSTPGISRAQRTH